MKWAIRAGVIAALSANIYAMIMFCGGYPVPSLYGIGIASVAAGVTVRYALMFEVRQAEDRLLTRKIREALDFAYAEYEEGGPDA